MYSRILIATDGSELAGKAMEHGLQLAKSVDAIAVVVTVTEAWSAFEMASNIESGKRDAVEVYEGAARNAAQSILEDAAAQAASMGVACETRHVNDQKPAEGIMDTATLEDCDLIVMASHGRRGMQKMLLGSQTAEVIALSKTPVLVLR
ncbi:universal stress protein [Aestuariicoccus sp. MJ-SS9]|uniref:universal stress protein n=1 Tax=Aestuariicoccus sp. MJ-SS9 TaxID=3079855 RepID=UPI0029156E28|nr:universal stress protein [Aestuariicoccus sp. MJ-SS9]MDU8913402.1 universal stress protein [Aestuariicoccus sp. MJ-SS9]